MGIKQPAATASGLAGDRTALIHVISDTSKLLKIEGVWNTLVNKCSKNPIFLSEFVKPFMEFNRLKGWTPLLLVFSADNMIIGIAPLMTKKQFGLRFVKFLYGYALSPDFIVFDQYRENCISYTLDFLLKTLRCQFADLTLPAESPNLQILKQKCKANRTHFYELPEMGHSILPIGGTWSEFKTWRGGNFRRKFKKIERKLDRAGSWRIINIENGNRGPDVIKKILDVERRSWKEEWRTRNGAKVDQNLLMIWKGSQHTVRTEPDFKWNVWFLELNNQTLAYTLVFQYKEVAFIMKTSYDERFKRFYPGICVINAAIRELFNKEHVRSIDFLTDLPFMRTWTPIYLPRVRVVTSQRGILPTTVKSVFANAYIRVRTLMQSARA